MGFPLVINCTLFSPSTFSSFLVSPGTLSYAYIYSLNHTLTIEKQESSCQAHTPAAFPLPFLLSPRSLLLPHQTQTHIQRKNVRVCSLPSFMAVATETQFHVLAVDDSLPDRKLIERLLKTSSFQVTTVDSGSKALRFLGLHDHEDSLVSVHADQMDVEVNLIITDYCMPGMTGYDLLKKIKESSSLNNIPVVIMSSENIPSRVSRCLEEGADEFFLKPVRLSDMSKLKPHILKSRCKEHYHQEQHLQSNSDRNNSNPTNNSNSDISDSRKRKAADDEILPQTIRPCHN